MRKDVRFGLTIGAILLAVLVVYVLVVPGGNDPDLVSLDTLDPILPTTDEPAENTGPSILDRVTPLANDTPLRVETTTPDNTASVTQTPIAAVGAADQYDWDAILTHGRMMAVDRTPTTPQPIAGRSTPPIQETFIPTAPQLTQPTLTNSAAAEFPRTHIVASGENFWTIAQAVYGDGRHFKLIEQANPGVDSSRLRIGQELRLPALPANTTAAQPAASRTAVNVTLDARQYRVQQNDSLHRIAQKLYNDSTRWEEIYRLNRQTIGADPAKLKLGMVLQLPETPTAVSISR